LFNSQLVTRSDGRLALLVPAECQQQSAVQDYLQTQERAAEPIAAVHVMDVTQSMRNGGGPACLRLRVPLTDAERDALAPGVLLDDDLYQQLGDWIDRHYRDRLTTADLADPQLLDENRAAVDELTQLLDLGSLYDFQMESE